MAEDSVKVLWEVGKEYPLFKIDYELPAYKKFIKERKFKLIQCKHPENLGEPYICVNLNGFNFPIPFLPGQVWQSQVHEVWNDDIITVSCPKTGTTWIQEIVWIITNNFDFETARNVNLFIRAPILDLSGLARPVLEAQKRPRQYHIHAPYSLLPQAIRDNKQKVIYVARNPKDTCVSMYHFYQSSNLLKYKGDFKGFATMFMEDEVMWAPYDKHVLSYWERRNEDHILFVTFEDLKKDLGGCIKKIATFLGKTVNEEQVNMVIQHASFNSMAKLDSVNREDYFDKIGWKDLNSNPKFMRKGIVGDWKNIFDPETNKQFNEWIEHRFGNSGLQFIYE